MMGSISKHAHTRGCASLRKRCQINKQTHVLNVDIHCRALRCVRTSCCDTKVSASLTVPPRTQCCLALSHTRDMTMYVIVCHVHTYMYSNMYDIVLATSESVRVSLDGSGETGDQLRKVMRAHRIISLEPSSSSSSSSSSPPPPSSSSSSPSCR
jgi:hypothetical protein